MRPARPLVVAAVALVLAAPAAAHVIASPTFVASGETQTIELSTPNERDEPMTGFVVTAPAGLEIVTAERVEGWSATVEGQTASWTGGSLPANLSETFGLRVTAIAAPGSVELEAVQRYADGEASWPVALTIVPGSNEPGADSGSSGLVLGVVLGIGVVVTAAIALLARRRRSTT